MQGTCSFSAAARKTTLISLTLFYKVDGPQEFVAPVTCPEGPHWLAGSGKQPLASYCSERDVLRVGNFRTVALSIQLLLYTMP